MSRTLRALIVRLKPSKISCQSLILSSLISGLVFLPKVSQAYNTEPIRETGISSSLIAQSRGSCEQFLLALGIRETGREDAPYNIDNELGFIGRYQFGEALLITLGYYQTDNPYIGGSNGVERNYWNGSWTGKNGINSTEDFRQNLNGVQEIAIREAFSWNWNRINQELQQNGTSIEAFIGQERDGVVITPSGILAAAHLRGEMSAVNLLLNGEVSYDEKGTSILDYLREFADYESCLST